MPTKKRLRLLSPKRAERDAIQQVIHDYDIRPNGRERGGYRHSDQIHDRDHDRMQRSGPACIRLKGSPARYRIRSRRRKSPSYRQIRNRKTEKKRMRITRDKTLYILGLVVVPHNYGSVHGRYCGQREGVVYQQWTAKYSTNTSKAVCSAPSIVLQSLYPYNLCHI